MDGLVRTTENQRRERRHAPEDRLVTPIPWATLGMHAVASPGSCGALEGGDVSVRIDCLDSLDLHYSTSAANP